MAELSVDDLPPQTLAQFADEDAAQFALDAALAGARHYCGWPVSPVETVTMDLDGPPGVTSVLSLPTLNLLEVDSVIELGIALDVNDLDRSRRKGTVTKRSGCWTQRSGAIVATVTHGFTESEAANWRYAVTQLVGTMSYAVTRDPSMVREKVGEVDTQWADRLISTDERLSQLFSAYRILPAP